MMLTFKVDIRIDNATSKDEDVSLDQLAGIITLSLEPLFSQLPCVDVNYE